MKRQRGAASNRRAISPHRFSSAILSRTSRRDRHENIASARAAEWLGCSTPHGRQAIFDFKRIPIAEMIEAANAALLVIALMETPTAIANAEAIAAVPGIDALLIGTNDLAAEMGIPGEYGHERVGGAYQTVIAACRKHNKWPGMGGVDVEGLMQKYIGMGMQLVLTGSDGSFMMAGASQRAALARQWGAAH